MQAGHCNAQPLELRAQVPPANTSELIRNTFFQGRDLFVIWVGLPTWLFFHKGDLWSPDSISQATEKR